MQNRLLKIILKIPRYLSDSLMIIFWRLRSLFFSKKEMFRGAWLVCERGIEARDNGFAFFKYLRENYPEKKIYYLIDSTQEIDYRAVEKYGNIIVYNSKEHWQALFYVDCLLSTHVGFITPWSYVCHKMFFPWLNCPKFVLLNHGITKEDMSDKLNKFVTGVDLFIAANNQDYITLVNDKRYGYKSEEVALTGYARYDSWVNNESKNQILLMPTWRAYLVDKSIENRNTPKVVDGFVQSDYYKMFERENMGISAPNTDAEAVTEAILTLYNDRKLIETYAENAKQYGEKYYSRTVNTALYNALYESMSK